jgi:DNA-binding CsgD family transcriptional regulator
VLGDRDPPEELLEALHAAALEPASWGDALRACGAYITGGSEGSLCAVTLFEGPAPGTGWLLTGVDALAERAYPVGVGARHPLFARAESFEEGFVGESERLADPQDLARSTLARDHLRANGTIAGTSAVLCTRPFVAALHVFNQRDDAPWREDAEARLRRLTPPLRRALETYVRFRHLRATSLIDQAVLDRLDVAALTLSPGGALLRSNARAQALLDDGDALTLARGQVACVRESAAPALREALARVVSGRDLDAVVIAPRRSGRRPLLLFLSTVREREGEAVRAVTVLARESGGQGPHTEEVLRRVFALTPTEARVALLVAEGASPQDAADRLGISPLTTRAHLKRVYDKTSTTGQSDLVRLVFGELPPISET